MVADSTAVTWVTVAIDIFAIYCGQLDPYSIWTFNQCQHGALHSSNCQRPLHRLTAQNTIFHTSWLHTVVLLMFCQASRHAESGSGRTGLDAAAPHTRQPSA